MSQQGYRQASVRAVTGTAGSYEGDWHALFDLSSIPVGAYNGRLLAWINLKLGADYAEINGAMAALALNYGAANFQSLGVFDAETAPAGQQMVVHNSIQVVESGDDVTAPVSP